MYKVVKSTVQSYCLETSTIGKRFVPKSKRNLKLYTTHVSDFSFPCAFVVRIALVAFHLRMKNRRLGRVYVHFPENEIAFWGLATTLCRIY